MEPIEGPRYKCKTCPDFNYCETCFRLRRNHRHSFHRFEDPSSIPVNAGKAGRGKKKIVSGGLGGPEHIVKEWDRVVKSLMVSSRESQAGRLIDGTESYWQSAGSQGKVRHSINVTWGSLLFQNDDQGLKSRCRSINPLTYNQTLPLHPSLHA